MASRKRKKLNKRVRLSRESWGLFWGLALLIVITYGVSTSKITQLRIVRASSNNARDHARLRSVLKRFDGVPQTQIRARDVENLIERSRAVAFSSYSGNILGSARIAVEYRTAVAKIEGYETLTMDAKGVVFSWPQAAKMRVKVAVAAQDLAPILCIADSSRLRELARIAGNVQDLARNHDLRLYCDEAGYLCFNIDSSLDVILGTENELEKKLAIVKKNVQSNPSFIAEHSKIIMVYPDDPTSVRRK